MQIAMVYMIMNQFCFSFSHFIHVVVGVRRWKIFASRNKLVITNVYTWKIMFINPYDFLFIHFPSHSRRLLAISAFSIIRRPAKINVSLANWFIRVYVNDRRTTKMQKKNKWPNVSKQIIVINCDVTGQINSKIIQILWRANMHTIIFIDWIFQFRPICEFSFSFSIQTNDFDTFFFFVWFENCKFFVYIFSVLFYGTHTSKTT